MFLPAVAVQVLSITVSCFDWKHLANRAQALIASVGYKLDVMPDVLH
jgi:hypothetical protein